MQSLRDQEALILQPRGNLPRVCAAVVAAVTTGGMVLIGPQRLFTWVAMAILMVTLGPLLHGLCLLPEELLHHSRTRYRGRALLSQVLAACGLWGKTLLAAGLAGLCLYLTGHQHRGQCWELLVLAPVLYALFKSLGVVAPSEVEVSDICEQRKMNVAHGLAWSFYLGYLQLVLPYLEKSIDAFRETHEASGVLWSRGSRKLLILIPLDVNISNTLEDQDSNIKFYDNLPNNQLDVAGVRGRVYKHSVYRVQDEQGAVYDCAVEYATPLLTLYKMSQTRSAGFGEPERRQQVLLFYRTLQDILEHSLECRNRYTLVLLDDDSQHGPHYLSEAILRHVKQQEKEEFCLGPAPQQETEQLNSSTASAPPLNGEWRRPEPMSREPTLMISLDRPKSLKDPEENSYPQNS
ncbi:stimulator of interferon genes protein [Cololabis saira]|uniref:stimulator of interferon genes protein n=1 Tax=Cololabis saira TaxID=129043 RepID=UPI002AD1E910|nr:stimulator of interferon genes protein [Cololabis saira]